MSRADPRPKVLLAVASAAGCCRKAGPAPRDQHDSERRAEKRHGGPGVLPLAHVGNYTVIARSKSSPIWNSGPRLRSGHRGAAQ